MARCIALPSVAPSVRQLSCSRRISQATTKIASDTRITITGDGSIASENGPLGKIGVVKAADPNRLRAEGATLLRADTPTSQVEQPGVVQGVVEGSNVPPVLEITRMMNDMRDFQFTTQLIQAEDDRIQTTIDKTLGSNNL